MQQGETKIKDKIKALIALSRLSNLPTIWSNCLAGWLLGGAGNEGVLLNLCFGVSCIYIGAMFMNDLCDIKYDAQYRPERPLPAGVITESTAMSITIALFSIGLISISHISHSVAFLSGVLVLLIFIYNYSHKKVAVSSIIVGLCRLILYLLGASIAKDGFNGLVVWSGVVLCVYIWGISVIARFESKPEPGSNWAVIPLFCPIGLAMVVNYGENMTMALICAFFVILWIFTSVHRLDFANKQTVMRAVSRLLAGIVLVDLLAVIGISSEYGNYLIVFPALFILTLILQKFVAPT